MFADPFVCTPEWEKCESISPSDRLLHDLGIDPPRIVFRDSSDRGKSQALIKLTRGRIVLRHFEAHHSRPFFLHLLFRSLHQEGTQPAAPLDRVHVQGDDVPCQMAVTAGSLPHTEAGPLAFL